jgi:dienelactone hydrolase
MEEMGAQYEVRIFGSQVLHGFVRPEKTTEQDAAMGHQFSAWVADSAWRATLDFLQDVLSAK